MARFVSDLVNNGPTGVTVFYNATSRAHAAEIERYRRASGQGCHDIRWRAIQSSPKALTLFGVPEAGALQSLWLVDRRARLRRGLDARIKLWAELPGWRWLAWAAVGTGVKALVARPVCPIRHYARHSVHRPEDSRHTDSRACRSGRPPERAA